MELDGHDQREGHCRMLGHLVPFHYCRTLNSGMPCRLVADCWHSAFDAPAWLREHFTGEQIARILAPAPPKVNSLLALIEKARQSAEESRPGPGQPPAGRE
jgi:hypothetical protein